MKTTVLVVDDNEALRIALSRLLESHGYAVVPAESFTAARHVLELSPDVVLLDLMLGGESGEDVLRYVRENQLKSRVIVMTAIDAGSPRLKALAALNPDGVLHKPMEIVAVLAAIGSPVRAASDVAKRGEAK